MYSMLCRRTLTRADHKLASSVIGWYAFRQAEADLGASAAKWCFVPLSRPWCEAQLRSAMRTKGPYAPTAIAHAAFPRSCSRFQTNPSPHLARINRGRDKKAIAFGSPMPALVHLAQARLESAQPLVTLSFGLEPAFRLCLKPTVLIDQTLETTWFTY
jgi:hypothetical protein